MLAAALSLAIPTLAVAHIERASYWPDPAPDGSISPPAGGKVPKARTLASALKAKPPGETRVVCKGNSLNLLRASIRDARKHGYDLRPHDHRSLGPKRAKRLMAINKRLAERCEYDEIQPAVMDSHNNDRVVVMNGLYREPTARSAPTDDPRCDGLEEQNDEGSSAAVSYRYQATCPNDQNLIAVIGREPGEAPPPQPPLEDRHGIPDLGPCIRCNLQLEGSGVGPDDVVVDAGRAKSGNGAPIGSKKDVGIRADRADGFVLRNVTVRHAAEHDVYVPETDGYRIDRVKAFYAGEYGILTFVADHGLIQNCEAVGNGDAGVYPGAAAETGEQRQPGTAPRYNQEIRRCDLHHNALGYSGTNGNAVHVHHNNFYDNVQGFSTDVFTASGHPGFPSDSALIEHNNFFSNNFNAYAEGSDVEPTVPVPIGTGLWIAGGNNMTVRNNRFWNNWRRGVMLFSVPDAFVCGPETGNSQAGCDPSQVSTSHRNRFYGNIMGVAPNGKTKPNGLDFWWDNFPGNTANCWYQNSAATGRQITSSPRQLPDCDDGRNPGSSVGNGPDPQNESELLNCFAAIETNSESCDWFTTPPKPGR